MIGQTQKPPLSKESAYCLAQGLVQGDSAHKRDSMGHAVIAICKERKRCSMATMAVL